MKYRKGKLTKASHLAAFKAVGASAGTLMDAIRTLVHLTALGVTEWNGDTRTEFVAMLTEALPEGAMSDHNVTQVADSVKAYRAVNTDNWAGLDRLAPSTVGSIGSAVTGKRADLAAKALSDGDSVKAVRKAFGKAVTTTGGTSVESKLIARIVATLTMTSEADLDIRKLRSKAATIYAAKVKAAQAA